MSAQRLAHAGQRPAAPTRRPTRAASSSWPSRQASEALLPLGLQRARRARAGRSARGPRRARRSARRDPSPATSLVRRTSSSPSGEPCALLVPCLLGDGPADDRLDADERRALLLAHGLVDRDLERVEVVGVVDRLHVPAVGLEALGDVLGVEAQLASGRRARCRCRRRGRRSARGRACRPATRPRRRCPPSGRRRRRSRRCGGPGPRRRSARAGSARPSPCRRRWRSPGPAGRW